MHLKKGLAKGEKERSCLREEIRGHLRVRETQQRQLEKVEKDTEIEQKALVSRRKKQRMGRKDHSLERTLEIIG